MKTLRYDGREFAKITDQEAESILNHRGMHLNFKGNLLKMAKVEIFSGEEKNEEGTWQKTTEQLREIVGEFENQLNETRDNIPNSPAGQLKAVKDGKLPDCGTHYLRDRGIAAWYVKNGWLWTEKKEGQKRQWALTLKYVTDGVPLKEEALSALIEKREFAKEMAFKANAKLIKTI